MEKVTVDKKQNKTNLTASQKFKQKFFKNMWLSILLLCLIGGLTLLVLTLVFWFTANGNQAFVVFAIIFFVLFLAAMIASCVLITLKSNVLIKPIVKKQKSVEKETK